MCSRPIRYYHTNLDTLDKTSPAEMANVGITVATTAMFVASADRTDSGPMTQLLEQARDARLETERQNLATPDILDAWRQWYREALKSVERLNYQL